MDQLFMGRTFLVSTNLFGRLLFLFGSGHWRGCGHRGRSGTTRRLLAGEEEERRESDMRIGSHVHRFRGD